MQFYTALDRHNCVIKVGDKHVGFFYDEKDDDPNMLYCDILLTNEQISKAQSPILSTALQVIVL